MDVAGSKRKGMGLLGMQERIRKIGGEFLLESALGQGTWIRIVLSLAEVMLDRKKEKATDMPTDE